jgi:hypothetical protein
MYSNRTFLGGLRPVAMRRRIDARPFGAQGKKAGETNLTGNRYWWPLMHAPGGEPPGFAFWMPSPMFGRGAKPCCGSGSSTESSVRIDAECRW